jgi:hypothetical protein
MKLLDTDDSKVTFCMILPRLRKNQERLFNFRRDDELKKTSKILLEQLFVYSGSIFFHDLEEQNNYLAFLGYIPSPRNKLQEKHFNNGLVCKNGYVPKENRSIVFGPLGNNSKFDQDPCNFIEKLAEIRNYKQIPESAHHLKIFREGHRPFN